MNSIKNNALQWSHAVDLLSLECPRAERNRSTMILYAAVARLRDAAILVEISEPSWKGNAGQVMAALLQHLRDNPESIEEGARRTFVHRNDAESDFFYHFIEACSVALGDANVEEHYFHVFRKDSILYSCLADDPDTRDQVVHFAFLEDLQLQFSRMYGPRRSDRAHAHSLEKDFGPSVRSAIHHHNVHHEELKRDQKVQKLLTRVEDFKAVMGRNINLMMENTLTASNLLTLSDEMKVDAQVFKKRTKLLVRKERKKMCHTKLFAAGVIVILLYMTAWGICGPRLQECRAPSSASSSSSATQDDTETDSSAASGSEGENRWLQLDESR